MNEDGSNVVHLVTPGNSYQPVWSHNHQKLAFISDRLGEMDIFTCDADGSHQTQLTSFGTAYSCANPSWSPDDTQVAFDCELNTSNPPTVSIYTIAANGTGLTKLTNDQMSAEPSWSPDGQKIVFISTRNINGELIYTMSANGDNQVLWGWQDGYRPQWSPDGSTIVYNSTLGDIIKAKVDLSATTVIVTRDTGGYDPVWSPDGTRIAFMSTRDGNHQIYIMNSDGSNQHRISNNTAADDNPSW
jgi:Tol biopolymer transport system component